MRRVSRGRLEIAAGSVTGSHYPANFDVLHVDDRLVVVADGMGDSEGSRVAGRTAVDVFTTHAQPGAAALRAAVAEAQRRVGAERDRLKMLTGCTLTALLPDGDEAWIVQIGDSRAYRLRNGVLELLTVDHTAAWLGAVNGWYAFDSAEAAAARYRLLRYIGDRDAPEPDVLNVTLLPGDVYLLCTDGLAEQVPYQRMLALLPTPDPVEPLLAESLAAGGRDNATAAVLRVR